MKVEVMSHGIKYYKDKGVKCPECGGEDYRTLPQDDMGCTHLLCFNLECGCEFFAQ